MLVRVGECLSCGMCCGDAENGWCEHLVITGEVGNPGSTRCLLHGSDELPPGCLAQPARQEEIYPWYKCGFRFVEM
jgi:hypothetical protein